MINITNNVYKERGLAIIQKIPTPITPINLDKGKNVITLAYFEQKSTIDYIGAAQGIPICFDAKETKQGRLPLQNIHPHQVEFMEQFQKHGGVAFLLVHCSDTEEYYFISFELMEKYWIAAQNGGRNQFHTLPLKKNIWYIIKTVALFIIWRLLILILQEE